MRKNNKRAIEMGFNWIFAFIAGGFILLLAIYATSRLIGTQEVVQGTEEATKINSLLDPLETGLASGESNQINFQTVTRIYNEGCDSYSNSPFGKQEISIAEKTFSNKFGEKSDIVPIKNKYVFMEDVLEGKKMYIFSMPFFMPFKVSDLIIFVPEDYCFYDTPVEIVNDLENLNIKNVHFPNSTEECKGKIVCFKDSEGCDIKVSMPDYYVQKDGKRLYFNKNLVYGAIFGSPQTYECNIKRLMSKLNEVGRVYVDKIEMIQRKACEPRIGDKLEILMSNAMALNASRQIVQLAELSDEIDSINEAAKPGCRLFS